MTEKKCKLLNWDSKIQQCQRLIKHFNTRQLTMISKIKTYLLPKFIHLFQSLEVSKECESKINQMFYTFLWNGKIERIKRKTVVLNYENGGLSMIYTRQFITSIKLKWLVNLIKTQTDVNWQTIPTFYFNMGGISCYLK